MKKFLDKAKSKLDQHTDSFSSSSVPSQQPLPSHDEPSRIQPPSPTDVLRYRYHHGTNLGSIFVLEKWLHGSMFDNSSKGGSELDAISASLASQGPDATKQKWENHWRNALSDGDLQWLVNEAKCTSIRLPIGYFTLGREFTAGTPYEKVAATGVYDGAWPAVKELVRRCRGVGIGVLLDLHALPGGANKDAHSGSSTGSAEFWTHRSNRSLGTKCVTFIARESLSMDGVIGIQVVNEACWGAEKMYSWYDEAIDAIARVDQGIPVYISDAWDLKKCIEWTNSRHCLKGGPLNPIIIDTHKYYTFDEKDRSRAPHEICGQIPTELGQLDGHDGAICDRGEACLVVGEYSCVLDGRTWGRVSEAEKPGFVQRFGQEQSRRWQQRTGGSFFWTYKMDWMDGGEWGFAEQTKKGNLPPPPNLTFSRDDVQGRISNASGRRDEMLDAAVHVHEQYWNSTAPGKAFQHGRYRDGWQLGFSDALSFFDMRGNLGTTDGADRIGCLDVWVKKRLVESGQRGEFVWEWEQGFRAGVAAFYHAAGV